jgi:hypothetical protein
MMDASLPLNACLSPLAIRVWYTRPMRAVKPPGERGRWGIDG